MISHYSWTSQMFPSLATVVLLILLSIYSGRRRVAGTVPFAIGCLFAALWTAGSVMEIAAVDTVTKIFWFKFQALWRLPVATASLFFILEYGWPGDWLTRRNLVILSIPCLLLVGLILTDNLYHLAWRGFAFEGMIIVTSRTTVNWIFFVYGYGLILLNLFVFFWLFIRSSAYRWPVAIMVTGQIVGRGLFLLDAIRVFQIAPYFNVPPIAFEYLMYAIALFGFRIFDPVPLAHRTAIAQMHTGMLVLDPEGRIVSLNPAAEQILGAPAKQVKGKPVGELLPDCPDIRRTEAADIELSLPQGQHMRYYTLEVSSLKDWREVVIGHLLLLHNVTAQRQTQTQLLAQQELVAALHEREQLARELHDSLGQVLGYISLQAQALRKRARDGHTTSLVSQLARLAEVAQEAHRDIRESIFSLKTGPVEGWSFFNTLRVHLAGYQEHYGILTELTIPEGVTEDLFSAGSAVQLLRVIQEALANARKHGRAQRVQVSFACHDGQAQILIADDGCGFDPSPITPGGDGHFGMAFMRERMVQIGGSLAVETRPGAGTQVALCVPIQERHKEAVT